MEEVFPFYSLHTLTIFLSILPHSTKSSWCSTTTAQNPYFPQLARELFDFYQNDQLDAFGLYIYGVVLSKHKTSVLPPNSPQAHVVLIQSIQQFPYNWSAWLDLAELCVSDTTHNPDNHPASAMAVEAAIEQDLQPILSTHYMYHFFCAHLQAQHQEFDASLAIYERWMDPSLFGTQSLYLLTQYAVLQYHLRSFANASRALEDIRRRMPYRLDSMDVYSNILYVQENSVALAQLAHAASQVDKYRPETCCIVGNYFSLKQQRAKAIQYFQRAVKIDRTFTSAWTLMGHEYVEWKQTANAMEAYRKAVEVSPKDYRAWYGLGQTYEFLGMYLYALYYYKQAVALRPYDARMWTAMGTTLMDLRKVDDAIRAYERAVSLDDMEGIATQKLAPLYQKRGEKEKAANCYMRHLELRYHVTNPNNQFGDPATSKTNLSIDTMLQGLVVDSAEAEALIYLAEYHRQNEEFSTAALFCSRLLEYPGPEKELAKAMLREIKTRQQTPTNVRRRVQTRASGPPSGDADSPGSDFFFSP